MRLGKFKGKLDNILAYWEEVEGSIKRAELLQGRVTVPAINELRYAGRQIVRAVALHDEDGFEDEFNRALIIADQYLTNADHDVIDASIAFVGRRINELNLRYGRAAIVERIKQYDRLCDLVDTSMSLIRSARRDPRLRNKNYDIIKAGIFEEILDLNEVFVRSDAAMALDMAAYENKIVELKRSAYRAYLFALLSLTVVASMLLAKVL